MHGTKRQVDQEKLSSEIKQRIRKQLDQRTHDPISTFDGSTRLDLRELSEATSALVAASSTIGHAPPAPPTFRGRMGALAVRVVARMLFWYTPQIRAFHQLVAETVKRHANALRVLNSHASLIDERLEAAEERIATGYRHIDAEADSLRIELRGALSRIKSLEQTVAALTVSRTNDHQLFQSTLAAMETTIKKSLDLKAESFDVRSLQANADSVKANIASLQADVGQVNTRLNDTEQLSMKLKIDAALQERRLATLLQATTRRSISEAAGIETAEQEFHHIFDATYLSFEDRFRGTREDIKQRLGVHLERLVQAGREMMNPVLDIGCGRGEWLELLNEAGFATRGVDSNRAMILSCRERGLNVTETDALTYMRTLPDASIGAVTGFHIVEHLPLEELIQVLDETVRILKPGGIAIFETPNPANLLVGANTFYYDPTHRNPLPAPTLAFLGESRGFSRMETVPLHPHPDCEQIRDSSEAVQRLNDYLYGPRDYAFVGVKSH